MERNPESPWNPRVPVDISPTDFEKLVLSWLERVGEASHDALQATHGEVVEGDGGAYAVDVVVRLSVLGGAEIIVLAECKHKGRPVERDAMLILESKLRDVGAHKGILFSTSGFQRGALEYATSRGIATVTVVDGKWLYETRDAGPGPAEPPPWAHVDRFAGTRVSIGDGKVSTHTIELDRVDALNEWLRESAPGL